MLYKPYKFEVGDMVTDGLHTAIILKRYSRPWHSENMYDIYWVFPHFPEDARTAWAVYERYLEKVK